MNNIIGLDKFYVWRESDNERLPDVSFIPPMVRRRMTDLQKIAVGVAHHVGPENTDYQMVFASRYGEWQQTIKLITQFHNDNEMSPAGFSNSVHNAAAGLFSLITKNTNSYTSIAAGNSTLEMAILKALTEAHDVMVVFAGEHNPDIYAPLLDAPAFGLAFMIKRKGTRGIKITPGAVDAGVLTPDTMVDFLRTQTNCVTTKSWTMQDD